MKTWGLIYEYPPGLIRCLAKQGLGGKRVKAIGDAEIAIASGLSIERIREIYHSDTWDNVPVKEMVLFCDACQFDPLNAVHRNRARAYYNAKSGPKFTYLKKSPWWKTIFLPLILKMRNLHSTE
jgi:hypothetical protein